MQPKQATYDVGVIVGRFQVPELHAAHRDLIESVLERHGMVIIVLGLSPLKVTTQNPLNFEARKQMILADYPQVTVLYANDLPSDAAWSRRLDQQLREILTPSQTVVLYGSRGSFIDRYHGNLPTQELLQESYVSGTEVRKRIAASSTVASVDFRRGIVWAAHGRYPTCFTTVDVAVLNEDERLVLLARKEHESQFRFIGGFADPGSPSLEADARREVNEEAHVAITDPVYLASFKVEDWRYRDEIDEIKTTFFRAKLLSGSPRADDDIAELKWVDTQTLSVDAQIVESHRPLMRCLLKDLGMEL